MNNFRCFEIDDYRKYSTFLHRGGVVSSEYRGLQAAWSNPASAGVGGLSVHPFWDSFNWNKTRPAAGENLMGLIHGDHSLSGT